ncbi:MAG: septum formation initiator family protein [Verrucomicrobia bacterium]|nr:septum formation initiator family protein [Verrucomicrobiota bacterium]
MVGIGLRLEYESRVQELRSQRRRKAEAWNKANRMVAGLIGFGILMVLVSAFLPETREVARLSAEKEKQLSTLAREEKLRAEQSRELNLLKTDPEYLEIIAREKIGLMKEGESIINLDAPVPGKN